MFLLRTLLVVFLMVMVGRAYRAWKRLAAHRPSGPQRPHRAAEPDGKPYPDLTDQDIDDADFEEIS